MRLKVITFDLDNTLWDVEPALLRAEEAQRKWLEEHRPGAMDKLGHDDIWELKKRLWKAHPELSHNVTAMRQLFLRELQLSAGFSAQLAAEGAELAFAAFLLERQRVELYSKALEVLQQLARRYRLGALTNGNADVYKTDAAEFFDFAFLAEEVGASKPAPDMFHAAIEASGARPEEILHVGDSAEHDVLGALRMGMHAVWINPDGAPWSAGSEKGNSEGTTDKEHQPHASIAHVAELPEAVASLEERLADKLR